VAVKSAISAEVFTVSGMSPSSPHQPAHAAAAAALGRLLVTFGARSQQERRRRRWTIGKLARRAHLSPAAVHSIEAGEAGSLDAYQRLATALGLHLEVELLDPRQRQRLEVARWVDPVHSAMGELEARQLRRPGVMVGVDEPYQHYQFAGRADVVAWDVARAALLHIENRTRFPDLQQVAGSYNAKRAYLAASLGARIGVTRWRSQTHVLAALWSSEVLHTLRLRAETFRALCPDLPDAFDAWWSGELPSTGTTSSLIVLDPTAAGRQRTFIGLDAAMTVRPRHRDYSAAAYALTVSHTDERAGPASRR
jgi:hypothetical protein